MLSERARIYDLRLTFASTSTLMIERSSGVLIEGAGGDR
jgi:hypothetical protein